MEAFFGYLGELNLRSIGVDANQPPPENPAPNLWALYHQMERWHSLPEEGGLLNQFYILMAELDALDRVIVTQRRQSEAAAEAAATAKEQMQMQR